MLFTCVCVRFSDFYYLNCYHKYCYELYAIESHLEYLSLCFYFSFCVYNRYNKDGRSLLQSNFHKILTTHTAIFQLYLPSSYFYLQTQSYIFFITSSSDSSSLLRGLLCLVHQPNRLGRLRRMMQSLHTAIALCRRETVPNYSTCC